MKTISVVGAILLAAACGKANTPTETEAPAQPAAAATPAAEPATAAPQAAPQLLAVGTPAPDFSVQDHKGDTIELAALKGKPVVLYWYPKDETPG